MFQNSLLNDVDSRLPKTQGSWRATAFHAGEGEEESPRSGSRKSSFFVAQKKVRTPRVHILLTTIFKIERHTGSVREAIGGYVEWAGTFKIGNVEIDIYADEEGMVKSRNPSAYHAELARRLGLNFPQRYVWGPLLFTTRRGGFLKSTETKVCAKIEALLNEMRSE